MDALKDLKENIVDFCTEALVEAADTFDDARDGIALDCARSSVFRASMFSGRLFVGLPDTIRGRVLKCVWNPPDTSTI